ncbi:MAG TPA: dTDP-4-dehydrorhamnose reductase [Candidatus Dormibacteraeota bacterium]|nr:dTDP-4-dehydrorhamnose reductase [Candidatus Dormibacteraeota bacterium]
MRIAVTGAGGQLGRELVDVLGAAGHVALAHDRSGCDVTEPGAVRRMLDAARPDVVVNCAAWTNVDGAEADPDGAYRGNALGPRLLAAACHAAGVRLCHLSTDFVFDGETEAAYEEWAPVRPLSVYGASKLAGEEEVRALCPDHQIVRTAWLYGRDGPNFVLTMLRLAGSRPELRVVADQRGSPTWTGHLAPALVRLVELGVPGTFHLSGGGAATRHEWAEAVVAAAGLTTPVVPVSSAEFPLPARRPRSSVLDNRAWRLLGEPPLPDWREGVRDYVSTRG